MKQFAKCTLTSVLLVATLASCGGGGDVAGDSEDFAVFPSEVKFEDNAARTTNTESCVGVAGAKTVVTIVGGQPPFRIVNTFPQYVAVDKTEASGKDPKFVVTLTGSCGDPLTILVLDYHSKSASVAFTIERVKPTATTP